MIDKITAELQKTWGYEGFRALQQEVIEHTLRGGSSLVVMPTGQGKSLCFQLPSLLLPDLTLVLSPLIALMKDQVDDGKKRGISALYINSSLSPEQRKQAYRDLEQGKVKLLYVTPERFRKDEFLKALAKRTVSLLAVDEAHCISQWGHDFRPDYTRVKELREIMGNPPTLALTATATPEVRSDILGQLGLPEDTLEFCGGFARPNLNLQTFQVFGMDEKVRRFLFLQQEMEGPIIVYFSLVGTLQKFSMELERLGISHGVYHGQMEAKQRKRSQNSFLGDETQIMLATPAFGLGVNKENVRQVIHGELPGSIEAYYQEVGRAGRDGAPALCSLLYDEEDLAIQMDFIKWANPEPEFILRVYQLLRNNMSLVRQQGYEYLREQLLFYHKRDFRLETVMRLLDRWGVLGNFHQVKKWELLGPIPGHLLDEEAHQNHRLAKNKKLLALIEMIKGPQDEIRSTVENYFDLSSH